MPQALAVVWEMLKDEAMPSPEKYATLVQMDQILGLDIVNWQPDDPEIPPVILALVTEREPARKNRNFAEADRIRDELKQLGYTVEDTPEGARVKPV
jgi:cysteinyl-tRNA synthetase